MLFVIICYKITKKLKFHSERIIFRSIFRYKGEKLFHTSESPLILSFCFYLSHRFRIFKLYCN